MFTYIFDNPKQYSEILQFVALFLLFVIGLMVYFISQKTGDLNDQISKLEMECPACPSVPACPEGKACPQCPSCPTCPSLTCDNDGKCPDCICPADQKCPQCPDCDRKCPPCNANADCPTVDDIISGIFPGRNPGITQNGKYFDVKSNESFELMPDYDFYDPQKAFPTDSILTPNHSMTYGSRDVVATKNTMQVDSLNNNTNTTVSQSLSGQPEVGEVSLDDMPRMPRGNMGAPSNGTNDLNSGNGIPSTTRSLSP
tara:strand:- start:1830 stop:2597 length:768 start_codon:yes stop_codon:yes gene_type:complete